MNNRHNGAMLAQPEQHAQTLRRACRFDVITASSGWHWWSDIFEGMNQARLGSGYSLVVRPLGHSAKSAGLFRVRHLAGESDGVVILGPTINAELLDWVTGLNVPVVLGELEHPGFSSVAVDHERALGATMRHLLMVGHCRIALVEQATHPGLLESAAQARRSAYRRSLADAGVVMHFDYEAVLGETDEAATTLVKAWFASAEPPTAIICGSDGLAIRVCAAARDEGLQIPGDLSVIGYGDSLVAEYLGLATVRLPLKALGQRLVHVLLDEVCGSYREPIRVRLTGELVMRTTCSSPPDVRPAFPARQSCLAVEPARGRSTW